MYFKLIARFILSVLPISLFAVQLPQVYCPQNHLNITLGMTTDQVINACGNPLSRMESDDPVMRKVAVTQIIYNNKGTQTPFAIYGLDLSSGSGGVQLEVDIIENKIAGIKINNGDVNSSTVCNEANLQVGDPAAKVYNACGGPAMVNNTFTMQEVITPTKPQKWVYQLGPYRPTVTLTFIDGKLQSIDQ